MAQIIFRNQAQRTVAWLAKRGVTATAIKAAPRRPYIEIDVPCPELLDGATEMVQLVNGLRRRVWAARVSGCVVTWNEQ